MKDLKETIFKTLDEQMSISEFETWLYRQEQLVEKLEEDIVLALFSFNYKQKDAHYEFRKEFVEYYAKEDFQRWKIVANLTILGEGSKDPERILDTLKDLSDNGYSFLERLGYSVYELEECDYLGNDRQRLLEMIQEESKRLLREINNVLSVKPHLNLIDFEKHQKIPAAEVCPGDELLKWKPWLKL